MNRQLGQFPPDNIRVPECVKKPTEQKVNELQVQNYVSETNLLVHLPINFFSLAIFHCSLFVPSGYLKNVKISGWPGKQKSLQSYISEGF